MIPIILAVSVILLGAVLAIPSLLPIKSRVGFTTYIAIILLFIGFALLLVALDVIKVAN